MILEEPKFKEKEISEILDNINTDLKECVEKNIKPEYSKNDGGHNWDHILYVIKRALELALDYDINYNLLYSAVIFHDIGCHIDRKTHEIISADIAYKDIFLNNMFNKEEMNILKEAIEDHRASLEYEPRSIYGKILSSADRTVSVKLHIQRTIYYRIEKGLNKEQTLDGSYEHAINKYGVKGYATAKQYINDPKYKQYLIDLQELISKKEEYYKIASDLYDEIVGG